MNIASTPQKISNVKISRVFNAQERGGCTRCFPHGFETSNATIKKTSVAESIVAGSSMKASNINQEGKKNIAN